MSTPRISRLPCPSTPVLRPLRSPAPRRALRAGSARVPARLRRIPASPGRNLQLRGSRDAVDGLVKRRQHALIRRVHPDEHRHAEHDSRRWSAGSAADACAAYGQLMSLSRIMNQSGAIRPGSSSMRPSRMWIVRAQLSATADVVRHHQHRRAQALVQIVNQLQNLAPVCVSRLPVGSSASSTGG